MVLMMWFASVDVLHLKQLSIGCRVGMPFMHVSQNTSLFGRVVMFVVWFPKIHAVHLIQL